MENTFSEEPLFWVERQSHREVNPKREDGRSTVTALSSLILLGVLMDQNHMDVRNQENLLMWSKDRGFLGQRNR